MFNLYIILNKKLKIKNSSVEITVLMWVFLNVFLVQNSASTSTLPINMISLYLTLYCKSVKSEPFAQNTLKSSFYNNNESPTCQWVKVINC